MDKQFFTDATKNLCLTNILVFEEFETSSVISIQMPGPYELEQAGDIESHIKVIEESVKNTLCSMDLEYGYWGYALSKGSYSLAISTMERLSYVPQDLLVFPFGSRDSAYSSPDATSTFTSRCAHN